jgi:zinc protease
VTRAGSKRPARSAGTSARIREGENEMKRNSSLCRWTGLTGALVLALVATLATALPARAQENDNDKGVSAKAVKRLNRAPVNKDILRVSLPRPTVRKLKNGLTVLVLEQHKLPTVTFQLWVRPGTLADPKDLPGLASFTADMLREGTATRTSAQIAGEVDQLGASLDSSADFGVSHAVVSASGLTDSTEAIADLLSDVVLHPTFPAEELEKYKKRQLANLEDERSRPFFLASEKFHRALYGDSNPGITAPTPEAIQRVTSDDLKKFHARNYVPGNAILGVAGDVKTDEIVALLEKKFGAWTGETPAEITIPDPERVPTKIYLIDRPGSVQTNIFMGNLAIRRTDPDFFSLTVMNRILGGGPQARLFMNLREEKGYTYGAYSNFSADVYQGYWAANTEVRTNVTDGSMHELFQEFKRIREDAVPAEELDEARHSLVAAFALSLERPQTLLNDWMTVQYFHLPEDYWDKYADHIAAVDAPAVSAVATKYVDYEHMAVVCVGDAKQIKGVLQKYGWIWTTDANGKVEP